MNRTPLAERFWPKVNKNGHVARAELGPCWEWRAGRDRKGYGRFHLRADENEGKAETLAHRSAWSMANGPIPNGLQVLHRCDNPPCVNLAHLWLGSNAENRADMMAKGRAARGDRHRSKTRPETVARGEAHWSRRAPESVTRGERSSFSKLSEREAREVISRLARGERQRDIASDYGVTANTIWRINVGRTWGHIERPA
jgi:hypothetical protein